MTATTDFERIIVVKSIGEGEPLGYVEPNVGMVTSYGTIKDINGAILSFSGSPDMWAAYTLIESGNAGHFGFSWPTGVNDVQFDGASPEYIDVYSGTFHDGVDTNYFVFQG